MAGDADAFRLVGGSGRRDLSVNQHGEMRFAYRPEWLGLILPPAISFLLPKRPQPFKQRECRPFFAGLLPEEVSARRHCRSSRDLDAQRFRVPGGLWRRCRRSPLALARGRHTTSDRARRQPQPLNDDELLQLLDTLPTRPLLAGREGLRLSLAGAQSELPVVLVDGRVALPAPGQPTTHILKPPIARFPYTTENGALVMTLAAAVGLSVAPVEARTVAGRPYLLVTRYDRRFDESGQAHRLHQEDFCQALGIPPEHKYASEGGPTFNTSFELLREAATRPAAAVLALLDAAIFNLIVGNADAHGKNFSLLYQAGTVSLAPFYDLLSTVVYPELSPKLAMKIAKKPTLEEIGLGDLACIRRGRWSIGAIRPAAGHRLADTTLAQVLSITDKPAIAGLDVEALTRYLITHRVARRARSANQCRSIFFPASDGPGHARETGDEEQAADTEGRRTAMNSLRPPADGCASWRRWKTAVLIERGAGLLARWCAKTL